MRGRILLILKFLVIVFVISILIFIWETLPIISGYGSKVVCSGVFVAGRKPEEVIKGDLRGFPMNLGSYTMDMSDSSVTGSVWGLASRKAIYRYGFGATLVSGTTEETLREQRIERAALPVVKVDTMDWPLGDRVQVSPDGRMRAALGLAFGDGEAPETGTRAVVVVYHGRIVAERYAAGFDRNTRLAGWSMTKGVTNALVGILVGEGRLNIYEPAPVEAWQEDDRSRITVTDLLHMSSGLNWWEFYGGPGDATRMLFREKDMGAFAMKSTLRNKPGKVFNYSSGTANILSSIIRKTVGDKDYYRYPYEQLFYRTGMYSAVLEADAAGTFTGSSYCYATARDWARFGLLYLHDGVWNGQRILPEGWVDFTRAGDSYGALWWLNKGSGEAEAGGQVRRRHPKIPDDCYSCEGYEGQFVWVIPSKDLVLVRLAAEHGRRLKPDEFVPAVLAALK
jgi:CubicO group peptidase (beta-lactamase class C family)